VGDAITLARGELGLSRVKVARASATSHSTVKRVEEGDPGVQVDTLCAVAAAVGLDLVVNAYRGRQPTLRDTGQLELAELIRVQTDRRRRCELEVIAGEHGESADVLLSGPDDIIHIENLGGQIDQVLDQKVQFGCFPWRFQGGEAAFCRAVVFLSDEAGPL
jgi:transcriptional regulator with XRE-family HTH domain